MFNTTVLPSYLVDINLSSSTVESVYTFLIKLAASVASSLDSSDPTEAFSFNRLFTSLLL